MEIVSHCRLKTASLVWQPRAGVHALTILCKATFALRPGESRLAEEQDTLSMFDTYADNRCSSLIAASDMSPFKRRADVLFYGHAYAPSGHPTPSIVARLIVGTLDKSIQVHAARGSYPQHGSSAAGFGPVAPASPSRAALLGRHARTWDPQRWNTRPLPDDVDSAFFNAAPVDQQLPELTGDETIVLEHLSPVYPRLVTRLSRIGPRATLQREDKDAEVRLRCDTLSIDGDRGVASLVFRGVVLLLHPTEPGVVTITAEGAEPVPEDRATRTPTEKDSLSEDGTATVVITASKLTGEVKPALPFVKGASPLSVTPPTRAWNEDPAIGDGTGTLPLRDTPAGEVLPFHPPPLERPDALSAPAAPLRSLPVLEVEPELSQEHPAVPEVEVEPTQPINVPPPPMIGPVPVPARPAPSAVAAGEPHAVAPEEPAPTAAEDREAALWEPSPIELSIEQVAVIAAEIAERRQDQATVLETHGLREGGWSENQRRWAAAIEEQAARGAQTLRAAYDAAYVARVEQFRGAITLEEYARILVALDRGRTDEALDALKIQRPALMPIVRLWTKQVAKDAKLADRVSDALRAAQRT